MGGSFDRKVVDSEGPLDPWAKVLGDFDLDGDLDIAIGGRTGPLVWYENPSWIRRTVTSGGYRTVDGEAGDVDGDGDLDLVLGGLVWYENPGSELVKSLAPWTVHTLADHETHDVELADLDGDGDLDIVTRNQSAFSNPRGNEVHVWLQNKGQAWKHQVVSCRHGEGLAVGDLDGDGDPDIVLEGSWLENQGPDPSGLLLKPHQFVDWHHSASVALGDLNGDGRLDVVLTPSELAGQWYRISWFEGPRDRSGVWREHVIEPEVETVYHSLAVADFDLDGHPDLATAEMHQGVDPDEVVVYRNLGRGEGWRKIILSTTGTHLLRVGDLTGDRLPDVIGANWSGPFQPVELWVNLGLNAAAKK